MEDFVKSFVKVKINYIYRFCLITNIEYIVIKVKEIN